MAIPRAEPDTDSDRPMTVIEDAGPVFRRYVALGDSQTEGVGDDPHPDGTERGWADRFAEHLVARHPPLSYANLAVRGRRIAEVHAQQLEPALALDPDLVSLIAGLNDVIRPRLYLDAVLSHMDEMQRGLRASGATVLTLTFPDLSSLTPMARLIRRRLAQFNRGLRAVASARGAVLLDLERNPLASDARLWCEDRLHLNAAGHRQLADAMAASLNLADNAQAPTAAPSTPARQPARQRLQAELRWAYAFLLPWIGRRFTGRSSGDGRHAKRPEPRRLQPTAAGSKRPEL